MRQGSSEVISPSGDPHSLATVNEKRRSPTAKSHYLHNPATGKPAVISFEEAKRVGSQLEVGGFLSTSENHAQGLSIYSVPQFQDSPSREALGIINRTTLFVLPPETEQKVLAIIKQIGTPEVNNSLTLAHEVSGPLLVRPHDAKPFNIIAVTTSASPHAPANGKGRLVLDPALIGSIQEQLDGMHDKMIRAARTTLK